MKQAHGSSGRNRSRLARTLLLVACGLTLWALFVNNATMRDGDYTAEVIQAIVCAALAVVLVALSWSWTAVLGRMIGVVLVAANLWTLLDAAGRRLPAVMGW